MHNTVFVDMFMQAGFALVETGLCRAKSAAHVMATNFMIYGLGMLGFWICGFAFMFGNYANGPVNIGWQPPLGQGLMLLNQGWTVNIMGHPFGLLGLKGFFLSPSVFDSAVMTLFLFEMVFMDTTATIPTGTMAERWDFRNFIIYGFWVGMFPYAIYGNWVWGGGWLAQLGQNFSLGHGAVDFAGSGEVHGAMAEAEVLAELREPAATPDPVTVNGIREHADPEAVDDEVPEIPAFRHRSRGNRRRGVHEDHFKEEQGHDGRIEHRRTEEEPFKT